MNTIPTGDGRVAPFGAPETLLDGSRRAPASSARNGGAGKVVMIGIGGGVSLPFVFHAAPTAALCRTAQSEN